MQNGKLIYQDEIWGMWDVERYISLLMGEIPRLTDDRDGYGPKGKDYLVHVDIPETVQEAFAVLKSNYKDSIRTANPLYATMNMEQ